MPAQFVSGFVSVDGVTGDAAKKFGEYNAAR
jgi:hypothetical protein